MEIKITETKKIETLIITDPKSGVNWVNDLMGNHGALPKYSDKDGCYIMTQNEYDWWLDLIERYQAADDRYYELCQRLPDDEAENLEDFVNSIDCDLEDYPEALQKACNEAEGKLS